MRGPARRATIIEYKINCTNEEDRQYTEPLMYAIRRHFAIVVLAKQGEFERFKRRNYIVLFIGLTINCKKKKSDLKSSKRKTSDGRS